MSKRSVTELAPPIIQEGEPVTKAHGTGLRREPITSEEMGEFEDAWEDELESDEEVVDAREDEEREDGMDIDQVLPSVDESEEQGIAPKVYIPGVHVLGEDETLEADESVYIMRHVMNVHWPCLSFDILRDNLGNERQRFPTTAYIVAGTQADVAKNNEIIVYKMSSLYKTQKKDDSDSDDDDDAEDGDNLDEDAILEYRSVPHFGGVNRVRAQPLPQSASLPPVSQPYHVATWAETGKVHIWDVRPQIESLDVPGYSLDKARVNKPVFTINSHGTAEGFAMDWASSGQSSLRLLTGDINSNIFLTTSTPSGFKALSQPFVSHTSSVEDLQWSPSEPTVFASCSADRTIQVWDVRSKGRRSVAGIDNAHDSDVNVIGWNRTATYLLISGGDEGEIRVWDLRNVNKKGVSEPDSSPVALFRWHKAPITSIEWNPIDDSIFAASGADDQVTLWDLAVEQDDEVSTSMDKQVEEQEVPSQLLFVHQGQKDIKEIHWHPQIPGTVVTTALDGFNVFKTISV
ncbi:hypothetical protein APHAL10511_006057 [Amanita phalloides]|nr:hypothetical protein APHAL10511_006057 [Amanita phalloides]